MTPEQKSAERLKMIVEDFRAFMLDSIADGNGLELDPEEFLKNALELYIEYTDK